jgi:Leucine-rich repeat (LRR) protein
VQWLDLSDNSLGQWPSVIRQMRDLRVLVLRQNQLKSVPDEIYQCSFAALDLSENELTTLPRRNQLRTGLKQLWLNKNQFTEIPEEVTNGALYLEFLTLNDNPIEDPPLRMGKEERLINTGLHFREGQLIATNLCYRDITTCRIPSKVGDWLLNGEDPDHARESLFNALLFEKLTSVYR